jgi:hypothetical protein
MENNHKTLYLKKPLPNPKFIGKTVDEWFQKNVPYFSENINKNFVYDGDTFEFMTLDFYKTTVTDCVNELIRSKNEFLKHTKKHFPHTEEHGEVMFMERNHPFAIYLTNKNNISMFNNGTYHFNFTLPTKLDKEGKIENEEKFINDHRKAIRVLQLFSPLFLAIYGSPDPFSKVNDTFSASSQRCGVSRYIGVGTYDTDEMKRGKILTVPKGEIGISTLPYWWFHEFHSHSSYETLKEIGMDVNFNKHYYHGIELRIFDYFPEEQLEGLLTFIVHLFDLVLEKETVPNYVMMREWNEMTSKCIRYGIRTELTSSELYLFEQLMEKPISSSKIVNVYNEVSLYLSKKYSKGGNGNASKHMLSNISNEIMIDQIIITKASCCRIL